VAKRRLQLPDESGDVRGPLDRHQTAEHPLDRPDAQQIVARLGQDEVGRSPCHGVAAEQSDRLWRAAADQRHVGQFLGGNGPYRRRQARWSARSWLLDWASGTTHRLHPGLEIDLDRSFEFWHVRLRSLPYPRQEHDGLLVGDVHQIEPASGGAEPEQLLDGRVPVSQLMLPLPRSFLPADVG
jgi:hypothetical protein